jgi:hypothetical protein
MKTVENKSEITSVGRKMYDKNKKLSKYNNPGKGKRFSILGLSDF